MKVLVTGGAGFIGSHLVDRLMRDGHEVVVVDNFVTGRRAHLSRWSGERRLTVIQADIRERQIWQKKVGTVDWIFHLAALADIVPSIVRPADYVTTNVTGTLRVLEFARGVHAQRVVYAASSSCYGIPETVPTDEAAPIRCEYPYALTKYLGEEMVLHWGKVYNLNVVSLRLFNVYGPRARTGGSYGAVLGVFLAQKLHGQPFTVVGDGTQRRDFVFVSDVVEAFQRAAASNVRQEIFNVGSGESHPVRELVALLGGKVVSIPKRPGEPEVTFADITKIREQLGWRPRVSLREGVGVVLQQIEDWRNAPVWNTASIAEATKEWFRYLKK